MQEETKKIIDWIKQYVENSGAKGVVVGNSGGKDSAVVIALCANALGKENVLTVALPCNSKKEDLEHAKKVSEAFNLELLELDITETYETMEDVVEKSNNILTNEAKINMKPRIRMIMLYALAQSKNYLVIGTGNACERYVGYTTKWGDSASDFNPIANFTVSEVLEIGRILGVPKEILQKPPSDGISAQTDEEKMGVTYEQIEEYMKTGKTDKEAMAKIEILHKKTEHKRRNIPTFERTTIRKAFC